MTYCSHGNEITGLRPCVSCNPSIAQSEVWKKKAESYLESLNWIMPKVHQAYHDGFIDMCMKSVCVEYRRVKDLK